MDWREPRANDPKMDPRGYRPPREEASIALLMIDALADEEALKRREDVEEY